MRETYLPVFWYQQKGELTPAIAAVIAPNIKVAATARTVMRASVYVGAILGGACLLAAAWVVWTARQRKMDEHGLDELGLEEGHAGAPEGEDEEQAQTAAGSVGDYATLPTHDAAMDAEADADANSNSSSSSQRRRGSDVALVPPRRKSLASS
jgi:hypothetical protein